MKCLKRIVRESALNPGVSRHLLDFLLTRFVPAIQDNHVLDVPNYTAVPVV
jgi:hypothetical protein